MERNTKYPPCEVADEPLMATRVSAAPVPPLPNTLPLALVNMLAAFSNGTFALSRASANVPVIVDVDRATVNPAPVAPPVNVPTLVSDDAVTLDASVPPDRVPAAAVTVIAAVPSNVTPLIARPVARAVAVDALPVSAALTVPALKFPDASRATIVDAVFVLTASVAIVIGADPS